MVFKQARKSAVGIFPEKKQSFGYTVFEQLHHIKHSDCSNMKKDTYPCKSGTVNFHFLVSLITFDKVDQMKRSVDEERNIQWNGHALKKYTSILGRKKN